MSEGEHTIISKIPRERLHQIASRKLAALGLPVRLGADRESLEGELVFSAPLVHPATGQPLVRARFALVGHDKLRFLDPPLSGLDPVEYYGADRLAGVEHAVSAALAARSARLQGLAARLRGLRLEPVLDGERLVVRAVVKTPSHAFELRGNRAEELRVSRVAPVGGKPFEVATTFPAVEIDRFDSATDLELWLVDALPRMSARPAGGATAAGGGALEASPPSRNAVTLEALRSVFGGEAMLSPSAPLELVQEFTHGGTHYRFVAVRESGALFRGRLIGPSGDVWSDRFDLAHFPGTASVVASALGVEPPRPAGGVGGGDEGVPQHLQPVAGEVWVMSVVVEQDGADEVRYVGTDIDGRPYGAARVLSRVDFETVFTRDRGGWRLLVRIDQVQDGVVLYRQMDRQRQPFGAPRRMPAAILVANFVPEAAAY